MHGGFSSIS
jgi:hypothetical protein